MMTLFWLMIISMSITFMWLMLKLARFTTPVSGIVGLLILGLGLHTGYFRLVAFGGGLLVFSLVVLAISKNT